LIKEGYASADSTNWTVIVGGRAGGLLDGNSGMRLFRVKGQRRDTARGKNAGSAGNAGDGEAQSVGSRTVGADATDSSEGARWSYEVDYESIFALGARKAADQQRDERAAQKRF
jgi:hypothetical protein